MKINQQITLTLLSLIVLIIFFEVSNIDIIVQDIFFDDLTKSWILDRELAAYKFIFYDGIKKLLITFAIFFLIAIVFFRTNVIVKAYCKGIIIVILSAIFVPLIIGGIKKYSNMPCPKNTINYGGVYPHIKLFESYPKSFNQTNSIKCFPAGHASGGFALFSLIFLFKTRRNRWLAFQGTLVIGWSMGLYKMLIGDHFLSHTVVTMLLAWLIVLIINTLIKKFY